MIIATGKMHEQLRYAEPIKMPDFTANYGTKSLVYITNLENYNYTERKTISTMRYFG